MTVPNRSYSSPSYRYGFNGKEKDDNIKGSGNSYDFGARIYDNRVSRFLSIDPDFKKYTNLSPYAYAANSPIVMIDLDGRGPIIPESIWRGKGVEFAKMAGIVNSLWKDVSGAGGLVKKFATYGFLGPDYYWEKYGKSDMATYDAIHELITNEDTRNQFLIKIAEIVKKGENKLFMEGDYTDEDSAYQQGVMEYNIATLAFSVGELTNLVKGGTLISKISSKRTTSLLGKSLDIDDFSKYNKVVNNLNNPGGFSRLSNNKAWNGLMKKHKGLKDGKLDSKFWDTVNNEWWSKYNKPYLDKIIKRGDKIKIVSDLNKGLRNRDKTPTHWKREIDYLKSKGYEAVDGYFIKKKG